MNRAGGRGNDTGAVEKFGLCTSQVYKLVWKRGRANQNSIVGTNLNASGGFAAPSGTRLALPSWRLSADGQINRPRGRRNGTASRNTSQALVRCSEKTVGNVALLANERGILDGNGPARGQPSINGHVEHRSA
jgi:hypothetical protein